MFNMKEPVAIVCPNEDLNIQMPNDEVCGWNVVACSALPLHCFCFVSRAVGVWLWG